MSMPKRNHRPNEENNVDSWLMSYADMITLLMCFFIIFVSASEPKSDKMSEVTEGLAQRFGNVNLSTPFQSTVQSLEGVVEAHHAFKDIAVEKSERGVQTEISSKEIFKPGSSDFDEAKIQLLSELIDAMKKATFMDYHITVESYTSDAPPENALYTSNWELSGMRAARLAHFLMEHGIPAEKLRSVGYGETRPKVPNLDGNGKPIDANREKNDRVVIKLERAV